MKATSGLLLTVSLILLCGSCGGRKSELSREGEVVSKLQHNMTQPEHVRKGAGIMLAVLEENENIKFRDYSNASSAVSSVRSEATVQAWIALLNSTENKLPDGLPDAGFRLSCSPRQSSCRCF